MAVCGGAGLKVMPGHSLNTAALVAPLHLTKPMKCVHSDTLLTSGETEAQSLRNLPKVTQRKRDGARIPSQVISPCQPCPRGLRQHTLITLRVWYKMLVSRLCPFPEVLGENRFLLTQAVGRTQVLLWD